jgi:hypothetical protein
MLQQRRLELSAPAVFHLVTITPMECSMRVVTTLMFTCFFLISPAGGALAKSMSRSIENLAELSAAVNRVFSKLDCTRISESSKVGGETKLMMKFRFRCEGVVDDVSALLSELKEVEGLAVEDVVNYPGVNPRSNRPSVDVRFDAIVGAGVEG